MSQDIRETKHYKDLYELWGDALKMYDKVYPFTEQQKREHRAWFSKRMRELALKGFSPLDQMKHCIQALMLKIGDDVKAVREGWPESDGYHEELSEGLEKAGVV